MATDLTALTAAIKLIADAANDTVAAAGAATPTAKLLDYENLVPDLMGLVPVIGEIPAEIKALQPPDYQALLATLTADLNLGAGKAEAIVVASLKLLNDIATVVVPDIEALIASAKA